MSVRKCASRSAFQITFKFARCQLLPKRRIKYQFPRQVFSSVKRVAAIMLVEAMPQIMCEARINLRGIRNAAEEIDVAHVGPPSRGTVRLYSVTLIHARDRFARQSRCYGGHSPSRASRSSSSYPELESSKREQIRRSPRKRAKENGGGGSRTPVRKALRHGAYMLISVPFGSPSALRTSKKRRWLVRWFSPKPYGPKGSGQLTV